MVRKTCAAGFMAVVLASCGGETPSGNPRDAPQKPVQAEPEIAIDVTTPDRALKTLWALQDRQLKAKCSGLRRLVRSKSRGDQALLQATLSPPSHPDLFAGNVRAAQEAYEREIADCVPRKLQREINSIKLETDSRAVAVVTMKNVTPLPEGVTEPSDYQKEGREKGEIYRYVFTRVEGAWRLEDVYLKTPLLPDEFRLFEDHGRSYPYETAPF